MDFHSSLSKNAALYFIQLKLELINYLCIFHKKMKKYKEQKRQTLQREVKTMQANLDT